MNYVYAKDFTALFVDNSVIYLMVNEIDGPTTFDFSGVNLMDLALETMADIMVEHGVLVIGLPDESKNRLDSILIQLNEPEFRDVGDYVDMFFSKFPVGTLCIWDKTLTEVKGDVTSVYSLVYIEGFETNHVVYRVYYSHLVEPTYFNQYGGIHAKELYYIARTHISDFASKDIMFRYPKDDREEIILDLLNQSHKL